MRQGQRDRDRKTGMDKQGQTNIDSDRSKDMKKGTSEERYRYEIRNRGRWTGKWTGTGKGTGTGTVTWAVGQGYSKQGQRGKDRHWDGDRGTGRDRQGL